MKARKFTQRKGFTSDTKRHYGQARQPQIGIANIPGIDLQRFFAYINFDSKGNTGRWLRKMDERERQKRFSYWVRECMIEHGFETTEKFCDFMGVKFDTFKRRAYKATRPIGLGFVLDIAYLFNKDPTDVFPELLWLRDIWMQDFQMMINAAKQAAEAGELLAVRQMLEAMKTGSEAYPFEPEQELNLDILLKTRAATTEAAATFYDTELRRLVGQRENRVNYCHLDELIADRIEARFKILRKEFDEIQDEFKKAKGETDTEATN